MIVLYIYLMYKYCILCTSDNKKVCRFLAIPFLLELRALMDWMFTDTTLALTSWLQMEDIFSSVFCIKCDRQVERVCCVALLSLDFRFYAKFVIFASVCLFYSRITC